MGGFTSSYRGYSHVEPTAEDLGAAKLEQYANYAALPVVGDIDTLYIVTDTDLIYYWDGAAYQNAGGSDDPIIDGEVNTYGNLPAAASHSGETYLVKTYSILYPTKLSGLYYSDGASWARRSDKVLYSITAFSAVNKLIKTADTDRQTIETGITIDSSENITGVNDITIGGSFTGNISNASNFPATLQAYKDGGLSTNIRKSYVTAISSDGVTNAPIVWETLPTTLISVYKMSTNASDIGGYYSSPSVSAFTAGTLTSVTQTATTTPTLLANFATNLTFPNTTIIPAGYIFLKYKTQKLAGSNSYATYFETYKRSAAGTETLILTYPGTTADLIYTSVNTELNNENNYELTSDVILLPSDRIVIKVYAIMDSGSASISIFFDGGVPSELHLPSIAADPTNYVPVTSSRTANTFYAAPNGSAGNATFRAIVAADVPTLNQNTTGSAATLTTGRTIAITGDLAYTSPSFNGSGNVTAAGTLATVNASVGSFGSATATGTFTVNAKGLITAASNITVTPALGLITGLGTGVGAALAVNVGTAGSPVVNGGALGTPSSGVATNLTGTAAGLTAGNVTTNANLTGDVTSVGNATTLTNAPVIAKVLTGYASGAGTVAATDSILQAIQKLNGNDATNANLTGAVTSVGNATSLGSFTSAQLLAAVTNETGTGVVVFGTAPTISLPVIDNVKFGYTTTATAAGTTTLTSANNLQQYFTGVTTQTVVLPVTSTLTLGQYYIIINNSTGNVTVQSSGANNILVMPAGTQAAFTVILTSGTTAASWSAGYDGFTSITGTGANVLATSPTLVTPLLGTPTSGTLTSCTGLPISTGVSGLGTGVATFLATPSSANLASAVTNETGTGALVFGTSPTFTTQITSPTAIFTGASNTDKEYTANSGASITLDPANGLYQTITLTANTTITLTTVPSSTTAREIKLRLVQDGTGGRTVAWSNITFATGSVPVVPTAANSSTYISIDGTNNAWIGFSGSNYSITSEIVIASATSLTTATTKTITSLTVPAGRWRLSGGIGFIAAGTTTTSKLVASISTVNNTLPTAPANGAYNSQQLTYAIGSTNNLPTGVTSPLDISVATTYYLVGQATFAIAAMTAYGFLTAEALS